MTRRDIDYNNPVGPLMFSCFKDFCTIERNAMEGEIVDEPEAIPQHQKPKLKAAHGADFQPSNFWEQSGNSSEEEIIRSSHGAAPYVPELKYTCPLNNHKHETMACTTFFTLCPKDRWEKIERRKVCWTCMKAKDVCTRPKCIFYKKVPEGLICAG